MQRSSAHHHCRAIWSSWILNRMFWGSSHPRPPAVNHDNTQEPSSLEPSKLWDHQTKLGCSYKLCATVHGNCSCSSRFFKKVMGLPKLISPFYSSPIIVEWWALLRDLDFCMECGFLDVVLEGDAQVIIYALKRDDECLAWYGKLIEEAYSKMESNPICKVNFIPWEGSGAAHSFAKHNLYIFRETIWTHEVLKLLFFLVMAYLST